MKVRVTATFLDKFNRSRVFNPGDVVEFEDERAKNIVNLGLGEIFKEEKKEPLPSPKPRKPKKVE